MQVNGAAVYARGGSMIPMDLLNGRLSAEAHRRLVQSAAEGNFNTLRIWYEIPGPRAPCTLQFIECTCLIGAGVAESFTRQHSTMHVTSTAYCSVRPYSTNSRILCMLGGRF